MKRFYSIVFATLISFSILLTVSSFASTSSFQDIPSGALYLKAANHLSDLGIMKGYDNGMFNPDATVTREQFARVIVGINGLDDEANLRKNSSTFPDIDPIRWSSGFINEAANKGFLKGMLDGTFHPEDGVTFAQTCTVLVKVLGYTDADLPGLWPNNYVEKAKILNLAESINIQKDENMPRWAMALMLDKLLNTNIKKATSTTADKLFSDYIGKFVDSIVIANSKTSDKLSDNQVETDKGIYYLSDSSGKPELGMHYSFILDATQADKILTISSMGDDIIKGTVVSAIDNKVILLQNGIQKEISLPDKTTYYYNSTKQAYDSIRNSLKLNSSIVLAYNDDKVGFKYGVIFDPVYGKPSTASNLGYPTGTNSSPSNGNNVRILKNGVNIPSSTITANNVIYDVTDIWGQNKYTEVVDNKIEGILTSILPNRTAPQTFKIDTTSYSISKDIDLTKLSYYASLLQENNDITALLDKDGKIFDLVYENLNFAFVLSTSSELSTTGSTNGTRVYSIKLKTLNGAVNTYITNEDMSKIKGEMVNYTLDPKDNSKVSVKVISRFAVPGAKIDRIKNLFGGNRLNDNLKIFNFVSNSTGQDCVVDLIDWSDIPDGDLYWEKIVYFTKSNDFGDINLLVLNDLFDANNKLAYAKNLSGYRVSGVNANFSYSLLINGSASSFSESLTVDQSKSVYDGKVYKVKMLNSSINKILEEVKPALSGTKIQAIDSKKIKLNDTIVSFKSDISFYYINAQGVLSVAGSKDIIPGKVYSDVSVYLDKAIDADGKAGIIVYKE